MLTVEGMIPPTAEAYLFVRTLAEDERIHGAREIAWDDKDNTGNRVASGVYWCCLDYEGGRETARVVLVR